MPMIQRPSEAAPGWHHPGAGCHNAKDPAGDPAEESGSEMVTKGRTAHMPLDTGALVRLRTQLDALAIVLGSGSEESLSRRSDSGAWSAADVLAHLGRCHEVFLQRLDRILRDDAPELQRYRAEDDPEWPAWRRLKTEDVLRRLRSLRQQLCAVLDGVKPEQLNRTGRHPDLGSLNVREWVELFLAHEGHHLYAIMKRVRVR
jgi:uncharacterized damage-inducible protein DinB